MNTGPNTNREEWIAKLTEIAYQAVLRRGIQGSFLDFELRIWQEVRDVVESYWPAANAV